MRIVHRMCYYWNTYVLFVINHSVKSVFKKKLNVFCIYFTLYYLKTNVNSGLILLILILFDQVLPNFFNTFECSLNFDKLFPKYLLIKFIFKSSNLIFNEAMTTVVLEYCFQNSQVLSVFMNKNKTCAINTHCFHDFYYFCN